jgi:hypothetical protein
MSLRPERACRCSLLAAMACCAAGLVLADESEISQVLASRHLIIPFQAFRARSFTTRSASVAAAARTRLSTSRLRAERPSSLRMMDAW